MQGKITKRAVDALGALEDGGEVALWDSETKGFGLRVRKASKVYVVRYRAGSGRGAPIRTVVIGGHGAPWTPETARAEAKRILGIVASGRDPAGEKAANKAAPTVADLAARFLDEHVDAKRKPRTADEYRRLIEKFVLPALGKRKVAELTRAEVAKLHHSLKATPYQANRVLAVVSKMFERAEFWGLRSENANPCRFVEKFGEAKRERLLSAEELARLGDAVTHWKGSPYVAAAIRLLVLTGARLNEVLTLEWSWIDFERGEARLPDSKTGAKTLHLPPPALAVLAALPRVEGNPFVIVGERTGRHLINLQQPWRTIRAAAGLDALRIHDLRHAFASVAACSGMGLPIIGKMLGHTQAATTHRYAHLASDPVKAAAASVAGRIADAMNGSPNQAADVVPLPQRR